MTGVEMQESLIKIKAELTMLQDAFYDLIDENDKLKAHVEDSTELIESAYRNGKSDGKKEMLNKIQEYFELKEKGAVHGQ